MRLILAATVADYLCLRAGYPTVADTLAWLLAAAR